MKSKRIVSPILLFLSVCMLFLHTACSCTSSNSPASSEKEKEESSVSSAEETSSHPIIEKRDAEAYYNEKGTVLDIVELNENDNMLSEADVFTLLSERGFTDYTITTSHDSTGNIIDSIEINSSSPTKHPIYETYYISESGVVWVVAVINTSVMANPISYNLESGKDTMTIVIEQNFVTSFDNATKRFFTTVPLDTTMNTIQVKTISAEALNQMTMEELNK